MFVLARIKVPGDVNQLISYVKKMKAIASPLNIPVGISDFQYEYVDNPAILKAVDYIHTRTLSLVSVYIVKHTLTAFNPNRRARLLQ